MVRTLIERPYMGKTYETTQSFLRKRRVNEWCVGSARGGSVRARGENSGVVAERARKRVPRVLVRCVAVRRDHRCVVAAAGAGRPGLGVRARKSIEVIATGARGRDVWLRGPDEHRVQRMGLVGAREGRESTHGEEVVSPKASQSLPEGEEGPAS